MKTTKNKTIKGIKILASGPLCSVLLIVPVISSCLGSKEALTAIRSRSRANKPVIADAGNDGLKQPNGEEVCAVSEKQLKAGLESNNATNQIPVPEGNSDPGSSKGSNGQSNQDVNSQSQIIPIASKRNTKEVNAPIPLPENGTKQGKLDQLLEPQPRNLEMQENQNEIKQIQSECTQLSKKGINDKLLKDLERLQKEVKEFNDDCEFQQLFMQKPEDAQEKYIKRILDYQGNVISRLEKLKKELKEKKKKRAG